MRGSWLALAGFEDGGSRAPGCESAEGASQVATVVLLEHQRFSDTWRAC